MAARKPIVKTPSRAQAAFLTHFEDRYQQSNDQLEKDVTAAWRKHPKLAPDKATRTKDSKGRPKAPATFSKSTYHSWRRQKSSPTVHDLEILCRVVGERQTLIVDPFATTDEARDDEMEWREDIDELVDRMANLSAHERSSLVGQLRLKIDEAFAKAAQRNPQEPVEATRSSHGRRR